MLLPVLSIILGFVLLTYGADRFVRGAASTARNLGVSALLIGLTVVGFGTSAPELLVGALASWQGTPALAVGNAVGSNIANVGLVIGVTALVCPLSIRSGTLRKEFPVMIGAMVFALILIANEFLSRVDGLLLALSLLAIIGTTVRFGHRAGPGDPLIAEFEAETPPAMPMRRSLFWVLIGLAIMLLGSHLLVTGGVEVARALGVSELVIGLTIIAVGTSLPELAASIMSALHAEPDIAIGNVIGSNMFNILGVMAVPGLIAPGALDWAVFHRDFPVMLAISLAFVGFGFVGPRRISRLEGGALFMSFLAYQYLLYLDVGGRPHAAY